MMDRKTYLEMCQACSVFVARNGKDQIPDSLLVEYNGHCYYPISYSLSFDKDGNTIHRATLHDLHANSINGCLLTELSKKEN